MSKVAIHLQVINDSARLSSFFAMLKAQTYKDWHLYVVDNGSNAEEKVKIREAVEVSGVPYAFFRVHPGIGYAAGNNFLFSRHSDEYVITASLDQHVPVDFLENLVRYLDDHPGCAVVDALYRRSAVLATSHDGSFFDGSLPAGYEHSEIARLFISAGYTTAQLYGSAPKQELFLWQLPRKRRLWLKRLQRRQQTLPVRHHGHAIPEYDIAVVSVSHNDLCVDGLRSLERARKASGLRVGVVIVDNGSVKYRANELVKSEIPDAHVVLREGNFGYGHSSNMGVREVKARYYLFLNPDTVLDDEKIFAKLWMFMQTHPDAGVVGPKLRYLDGRLQGTCWRYPSWYVPFVMRTPIRKTSFGQRYAAYFQMQDFDHEVTRVVDWVQGSALCIDAHVLHEIGGFDERYFMYFEDIDLCRSSKKLGKKVYYYPDATLKHAHGKESARVPGFFRNLLTNRIARAHIASWLKYMLKWGF